MDLDPRLSAELNVLPYPLLFATVSGAHLYGFPSPDSDYDLRGCHILPLADVIGLDSPEETLEIAAVRDSDDGSPPLELDLVSHDARKFFALMLKRNGYVMEQLFSPLVVRTTPAHSELKRIAQGCLTRHHSHHYLGFAETEWKLFLKQTPRRVKPLLYVYRVLLTGIHLMRAGEIEANLPRLNEAFQLPFLDELIARKRSGPERTVVEDADLAFHEREFTRLRAELEAARDATHLPSAPSSRAALNDLLVRLRLDTVPR